MSVFGAMANIKFRAMYPKEGNDHMIGFALLEDGTLVRVGTHKDGGLAITEVKVEDDRPPKAAMSKML